MQRFRKLFRSDTITIRDYCCRPVHSGCCGEERASSIDFTITRNGAFQRRVNGRDHLADPNLVTFFNRNEPYYVTHPIPGGDDCTVITVSDASIRDIVARYDSAARERPDAPFPFADGPIHAAAIALLHRIQSYLRSKEADPVLVDEVVLRLAEVAVRSAFWVRGVKTKRHKADTMKAHTKLADDVRSLLNERFRSPLSLANVADAVYASAYHLARVFRSEQGVSVHQYLNRVRLRSALECVAESDYSLTAIALDHGFSSHSHFTDSFRREFDVPPSEFRKGASARRLREMSKNLEARLIPTL